MHVCGRGRMVVHGKLLGVVMYVMDWQVGCSEGAGDAVSGEAITHGNFNTRRRGRGSTVRRVCVAARHAPLALVYLMSVITNINEQEFEHIIS